MSKTSTITEHIEITPGICGGKPRIAGHRIRVEDIVICYEKMGLSPDEIVSQLLEYVYYLYSKISYECFHVCLLIYLKLTHPNQETGFITLI
ncbi:DUF433 domain-containing protein [Dapis sp. BLCC M172]|uniref:DUF433 domain-containing protein n=1 Tax=Dapis sp. BLCC M172 TaxID=2975281 RepID=UPI003CFA3228